MQHAAATMGETMREVPETNAGFCAFLRLRQGASARATWILEESKADGGTMISVGSDPSCDWQVRAAFVPARAFSLLIVGGRTFVRSGPEPGVLLNGKPVDDGWVQVPHGARIDVGLARLEVTMGYSDTSGQLVDKIEQVEQSTRRTVSQIKGQTSAKPRSVGRTTMNLGAIPIAPVEQAVAAPALPVAAPASDSLADLDDLMATTRRPAIVSAASRENGDRYDHLLTAARKQPRPQRLNATMELQLEDVYVQPDAAVDALAGEPRLEMPGVDVPPARLLGQQSGEFDVGATSQEPYAQSAPALLEVENAPDKRRWWLYAVASAATAGAYGGWLMLLDRL